MIRNKEMKKIIIITGASRGIGRKTAIELAKQGHTIIANYHQSEKEAKQLEKEYPNITAIKADVTQKKEVQALIEKVYTTYGKIDVLINNAGISQIKLFTELTEQDWEQMIKMNLTSAFYTTQTVSKIMIQQKQGLILNISSIWGQEGASCEVHYATAKAGINGMTKALAKELGPSGIRVNAIAPGIINTQMNADLTPEELQQIQKEIPLETIGEPEEIAKCIKWLIEDTYTTGQIIAINGGWYM